MEYMGTVNGYRIDKGSFDYHVLRMDGSATEAGPQPTIKAAARAARRLYPAGPLHGAPRPGMRDLRKTIARRLVRNALRKWCADARAGRLGLYGPDEIPRYASYAAGDPGGEIEMLSPYGVTLEVCENFYMFHATVYPIPARRVMVPIPLYRHVSAPTGIGWRAVQRFNRRDGEYQHVITLRSSQAAQDYIDAQGAK